MPRSPYSKRSRQPSGNAARANDPASQPIPSVVMLADAPFTWDGGNLTVLFTRPVVLIPSVIENALQIPVRFSRANNDENYGLANCTQPTPTTIEFEFDGAPSTDDKVIICSSMFRPCKAWIETNTDESASIRGLDNGEIDIIVAVAP